MIQQQFKPDEGFLITKKGISILAQVKLLTKTGSFLTNDQQIHFCRDTQIYLDAIQGKQTTYDKDKMKIVDYTEPENSEDVFYKYVSTYDLENYIKKDEFKFGTLNHYQKAENNKIKDEKEGYTHLILESAEKQLLQSFCTGYNYLIFCGSYIPPTNAQSKYLRDNFGECVIKIHNVSLFKKEVQKLLQSNCSYYSRIEYNEMKILKYLTDRDFTDTSQEIIDDATFSLINSIISPNTIFRKTNEYVPEFELRFAFETNKDQLEPVYLNNKGLLDFIEIVVD